MIISVYGALRRPCFPAFRILDADNRESVDSESGGD
jgi:hypothetical protein